MSAKNLQTWGWGECEVFRCQDGMWPATVKELEVRTWNQKILKSGIKPGLKAGPEVRNQARSQTQPGAWKCHHQTKGDLVSSAETKMVSHPSCSEGSNCPLGRRAFCFCETPGCTSNRGCIGQSLQNPKALSYRSGSNE